MHWSKWIKMCFLCQSEGNDDDDDDKDEGKEELVKDRYNKCLWENSTGRS